MFIKRGYFITVGVLSHFAVLVLFIFVAKHYDLTPSQFLYRVVDKLGITSSLVEHSAISSSFDFPPHYYIEPHLTSGVRFLKQVKQLINNQVSEQDYPADELKLYHPCRGQQLLAQVACSVLTKDHDAIEKAKQKILAFNITLPNASGHYANGWQLGFAYNALKPLTNFSEQEVKDINEKLKLSVKHYLILLNGQEASMWHGRTTLTSQVWLTFLAMDDLWSKSVIDSVAPHFYSMVDALTMTQAWPEGYNYWINSRAFYVVLALSSYLNSTEIDNWHPKVYGLLEKIGHWHIQATRPDWTIEPLGDEGPRVDLKDESRRVIDIIAQATQQDIFVNYSHALKKLHGIQSYYVDYRWGWSLFYPVKLAAGNKNSDPLALMDIFGQELYGQSYIRENWLNNATFMSFRAGNTFTHHGHYDNGHISLFKGAPLLVNSSVPGNFFGENRLNYGIRTIAKNSIIIQRINEEVNIGFNYDNNIADGGQRVTLPLGSAITTVKDWFEKKNKSPFLVGGNIVHAENTQSFSYIKADLTKAYNSSWYDDNKGAGKVELVEREILYVRSNDTLIIKDKVRTSAKNQVKVVFHTVNKPEVANEKVLKGLANNGITSTQSKLLKIKNNQSFLITEILADIDDIRLIGGKDYQFYVETDGDDAVLDGKNFTQGVTELEKAKGAKWRFEINGQAREQHEIITTHRPALNEYRKERTKVTLLGDNINAYHISTDMVVLFTNKVPSIELLESLSAEQVLICGVAQPNKSVCSYVKHESVWK